MDRSPVRLIAADRDLALDVAGVRIATSPPGLRLDVTIAGFAVPAAGTVALSGRVPSGDYEAVLQLLPEPSCTKAPGAVLAVGGAAGPAIQVVLAQTACSEARFHLANIWVP